MIDYAVRRLFQEMTPDLTEILSPTATLVPVPRFAPFPPAGPSSVLWVPRRICEALHAAHLGSGWIPCLERTEAVVKSATAPRGQRPTASRHYATLKVNTLLPTTDRVVVVDDVVTLGATAMAAASRLQDALPDAEVSVFAIIRTCGLVAEIDRIVDPVVGTISLSPGGRPYRAP
jgi:hypothetical protein